MTTASLPPAVRFHSVNIYKSESLGSGSYGFVCKAECDGLSCAAKVLYSELEKQVQVKPPHRHPLRRFERECELLCALRHPNVVQYLEKIVDQETGRSVLLMELLDENLTHYLERAETSLPLHTQVNICHDIALALSFLHSNGIIHRDLSSNNVLMLGDRRAKVTDFGMATVFDGGVKPLTGFPGNVVYMPPEAQKDDPDYTVSIDCFSYGVLTLQILTLVFPNPTSQFVPISDTNSSLLHKKVSEIERRQSHIELVPSDHHLLPLALECLRDEPQERPSAPDICLRLQTMKTLPIYSESERVHDPKRRIAELEEKLLAQERAHSKEIKSLRERHAEEIEDLEELREKELLELKEQHLREVAEKKKKHTLVVENLNQCLHDSEEKLKFVQHDQNHRIMELQEQHSLHLKAVEDERDEATQQCKYTLHTLKERDTQIKALRDKVRHLEKKVAYEASRGKGGETEDDKVKPLLLSWKQRTKPAPLKLTREDSDCVVCKNTLYLRPDAKRNVFAYNPKLEIWQEMPKCPHRNSTLAKIGNTVLAVGGRTDVMEYLNKIYYLTEEAGRCGWVESDFPMRTRRCSVTAVSTESLLIVAGGEGEETCLRKVEVMDIASRAWSVAAELPEALVFSSAAVCDDRVYLLGGLVGYNQVEKNSVFMCEVVNLLKSCTKGTRRKKNSTEGNIWRKLVGPPVTQASCLALKGQVFAVGGRGADGKPTSAVYGYNVEKNSWSIVTFMTLTRSKCFATVLPDNDESILVIGGVTASTGKTETIETGRPVTMRGYVSV